MPRTKKKQVVSKTEDALNDNEGVELPMDWQIPSEMGTFYANNLLVQYSPYDEFILYFFEAYPPIVIGSLEQKAAMIQNLKSVSAKCVARVVISAERMPTFMKALQLNFDRFGRKVEESEVND